MSTHPTPEKSVPFQDQSLSAAVQQDLFRELISSQDQTLAAEVRGRTAHDSMSKIMCRFLYIYCFPSPLVPSLLYLSPRLVSRKHITIAWREDSQHLLIIATWHSKHLQKASGGGPRQ